MRLGTVFSREGGQLPGFGPSRRRKCKQAAGVAGDDEISDEGTTFSCAIASEGGSHLTRSQIPHFQRLIIRGGNGALPVRQSPPPHRQC